MQRAYCELLGPHASFGHYGSPEGTGANWREPYASSCILVRFTSPSRHLVWR